MSLLSLTAHSLIGRVLERVVGNPELSRRNVRVAGHTSRTEDRTNQPLRTTA